MADKEKKGGIDLKSMELKDLKNLFSKKGKNDDGEFRPEENFQPVVPEINILPKSFQERYEAERVRNKFLIVAAGITVAFIGLWGVSIVTGNMNQAKVDEISASTSEYRTKTSALSPYMNYRSAVEAKRTEIAGAMTNEVDISAVNNSFSQAAAQSGFDTKSISLAISGSDAQAGSSCVNPDPFNSATGIGCLKFSLEAGGDLVDLFERFNKSDSGFINAFVPNTATSAEGATIEGTVSITDKFYTQNYTDYTIPLDSITANETPAAEAPAEDTEVSN